MSGLKSFFLEMGILFVVFATAAAEDKKMTHAYKQAGELKILADVYPAAGEKRPVVV